MSISFPLYIGNKLGISREKNSADSAPAILTDLTDFLGEINGVARQVIVKDVSNKSIVYFYPKYTGHHDHKMHTIALTTQDLFFLGGGAGAHVIVLTA